MANETIFVNGLKAYKPHENAPDFVKLNFQVFVDDLCAFLQENKDEKGQVRFDLKKSKNDKLYLALNTYKKEAPNQTQDNQVTSGGSEQTPIEDPNAEAQMASNDEVNGDIPF